jgi:hypothetical protein
VVRNNQSNKIRSSIRHDAFRSGLRAQSLNSSQLKSLDLLMLVISKSEPKALTAQRHITKTIFPTPLALFKIA